MAEFDQTTASRAVLIEVRAGYGKAIVSTLSAQLTVEYGKGFSRSNLFAMLQSTAAFPDFDIVQTLSGQLSCCNWQRAAFAWRPT